MPVAAQLPRGVHCAACQLDAPPFTFAIAPLVYAFPVDAAIKAMKFRRKLFYVPAFAHLRFQSGGGVMQTHSTDDAVAACY